MKGNAILMKKDYLDYLMYFSFFVCVITYYIVNKVKVIDVMYFIGILIVLLKHFISIKRGE